MIYNPFSTTFLSNFVKNKYYMPKIKDEKVLLEYLWVLKKFDNLIILLNY